jgi:glycosyltransferase involved in cell wall biosynthesis
LNRFTAAVDVRMRTHPGIGRYIRELTQALPVYGPDFSFDLLERAHAPIYGLREQWEIPALAKRADLLHVPHFNFPLNWKKPLVVTIHDLIYLSYPSAAKSNLAPLYLRFMLNQLAKRDAKIVAVSEFTKRELLRIFPGFKAKNITVTYEAVSDYFRILDKDDKTLPDIAGKFALKTPFVLFVGSLKPHKNIPALIRALAAIKALKKLPHELILAGRVDGANTELRQLLTEHSFVRCIGNTSDEELRALYNRAETLVMPSFFEGFGLPVLEAMACGCPVIASTTASLPEVGGEAAVYFDPRQVDALERVLYNVLTDSDKRNSMKKKGLEQIHQFSWIKTANQTLEVYRQALQK